MNELYIKTMRRLSQIPDKSIKLHTEKGDTFCFFISNLRQQLIEEGDTESADRLYQEANKKLKR